MKQNETIILLFHFTIFAKKYTFEATLEFRNKSCQY